MTDTSHTSIETTNLSQESCNSYLTPPPLPDLSQYSVQESNSPPPLPDIKQETLEKRLKKIGFFKRALITLSVSGALAAASLTLAPYFISKPEVVQKYESGKRLIELVEDNKTYTGEILARNRFRSAVDYLKTDLSFLEESRVYQIESEQRKSYARNLKRYTYSCLIMSTLGFLGSAILEKKEKQYKKRLEKTRQISS